MRRRIEGLIYYLSCMVMFHLVFDMRLLKYKCLFCDISALVMLVVGGLCALLGIIATILIVYSDDSKRDEKSLGIQFEISCIEDITADTYLINYSLIILTGLSLPLDLGIVSLCIYLFVVITIGIIYIKKNLFYVNPVITLIGYNIYRLKGCSDRHDGEYNIILITRSTNIGQSISYRNTNGKIIKINKSI